MRHQQIHADELDVDIDAEFDAEIDARAPLDEIEFEDLDDVETATEVEQFLSRLQATRFSDY